ncbi:MAG: SGNH/GDSL hydrolase family protein [Acidobacteriota bacterium]|nr:SGNH/GDSL hydrolase family protein [Acidobacteriota bacterium]
MVFASVVLLLTLLLLEALSWLPGRAELPDPLISESNPEWRESRVYDPLLFWALQPGYRGEEIEQVNALGLRGPEVGAKESGELRILSLGESTTFGAKVAYEESYSAVLQQELGRCAPPGRIVRVINAGVPGYSLFQGVTYLEHRGLELDPDLVLFYFGYNDFLKVSYRAMRDAGAEAEGARLTDREIFERRQRWPVRASEALAEHSNLYRWMLVVSGAAEPAPRVKVDRSLVRVPAEDRRELFGRALGLCRERGITPVIVVPWYRRFHRHEALLRQLAEEHGVVTVDLPARFADLPEPRHAYFLDRVHPNPEGHRRMAAAMAEALVAKLGDAWQRRCPPKPPMELEPEPQELAPLD